MRDIWTMCVVLYALCTSHYALRGLEAPMFPRITGAAVLIAIALLMTKAAAVVHAAPPNRLYGTVMLNGAPAASGTPIVAMAKGKTCGSTTVTAPNAQG